MGLSAGPTCVTLGFRDRLSAALDLLFPPRCVGCGEFETLLCSACESTLKALDGEGCARCGRPGMVSTSDGWCRDCVDRDLRFSSARSAFEYTGVAQELVAALKYGGQRQVAKIMAKAAAEAFMDLCGRVCPIAVTWVPSHSSVVRDRGYNQAELLARELTVRVRVLSPVELVRKTRKTAHQQALGREERARNLAGAFSTTAVHAELHSAGSVVLVDDVYTTGATASAVADAIRRGNRQEVYVFTFARALGEVPCFAD